MSSGRLNIAHLFQSSNLRFHEPIAAQLHMYYTIHELQKAGHRVALLTMQRRRAIYTEALDVFRSSELPDCSFGRLGLSGTAPFKLFESGVRRIQTGLNFPYLALFDGYRMYDACCQNLQGYDLIHERYNLLALGGALASRKLGLPYFLEVNADLIQQREFKGTPEKGLSRLWAVWATRFCFNVAAKIICVSAELKDHLHHKWNIEAGKLVVLPCAADTEAFGRKYNSKRVRQSLGLTTEPVVMWVGGFYKWHDLDLLLDSFRQVLQTIPEAKLVLVGDGETRPLLEQEVMNNGLRPSVIMTGRVAHEKIPELLSIADVAVVPSAPAAASQGGTGTPLKLFEYMAAGKAIVATGLNHATVVIRDGHNGLLVAPRNANAFAEAIIKVLSDPLKRQRLSQNARQEAIEQHSWQQYNRRLEEIYLSVLGSDLNRRGKQDPIIQLQSRTDE